jgi:hypothetical protein
MKRGAGLALIAGLLAGAPVLANGFGASGAPPGRIPIPARDYRATVVDNADVSVEVTQVTYNGEVYLYGQLGEGKVTVPFDTIRQVLVEPANEVGKKVAFVTLNDGTSVRILVEDDVPAYGRTSFGTYSITLDKVRRIEFHGLTTPDASP